MKNLIFDVNVILDLWLERQAEEHLLLVAELLETSSESGHLNWVGGSSLHIIEYLARREFKHRGAEPLEAKRVARELLEQLLRHATPLTCFGFQQDAALVSQTDLEDAQIVQAASLLSGPSAIVTNQGRFDVAGSGVLELSPGEAREWLRDPADSKPDFVDLKTQQDSIRLELERRLHTVLHHGKYILGPEVAELEKRLCEYTGAGHAVVCSSGTDALLMALMALDVGPGDAVFTTPFTFVATADVIARLGAIPVFVDIDPLTYTLDPGKLGEAVNRLGGGAVKDDAGMLGRWNAGMENAVGRLRPRAVIAVDLYGLPCDYDAIGAVAEKHGLSVIQDGAQSFGATYKGRQTGTLGHISCTSFFPSKPLGGYGDGGACFTGSEELADRLRSIRVHGQGKDKYDTVRLGIKGRMDTLQAAIVLAKLEIYPRELEAREQIARRYAQLLSITPSTSSTSTSPRLPAIPPDMTSAWALYTLLAASSGQRAEIQARLTDRGVPSAVYYAKPLHLQPVFAHLGYGTGDFPAAEECASRVFSLPMHAYLSESEVSWIVEGVAG